MRRVGCQRWVSSMYCIDMNIGRNGFSILHASLLACALCCLSGTAIPGRSQQDKASSTSEKQSGGEKSATADKAGANDKSALPQLPADAHVQQSLVLDGKTLKYTVTVGSLPVRDNDGKTAGQVVYTAYTVDGENRPVTFALNGGPGASSVYLNFGAIGPKHLQVGNEGDSPRIQPCSKITRGRGLTSPILFSLTRWERGSAGRACLRRTQRSCSIRPGRISSIFHA